MFDLKPVMQFVRESDLAYSASATMLVVCEKTMDAPRLTILFYPTTIEFQYDSRRGDPIKYGTKPANTTPTELIRTIARTLNIPYPDWARHEALKRRKNPGKGADWKPRDLEKRVARAKKLGVTIRFTGPRKESYKDSYRHVLDVKGKSKDHSGGYYKIESWNKDAQGRAITSLVGQMRKRKNPSKLERGGWGVFREGPNVRLFHDWPGESQAQRLASAKKFILKHPQYGYAGVIRADGRLQLFINHGDSTKVTRKTIKDHEYTLVWEPNRQGGVPWSRT